jgi:Tfp pilus assembly protein PilF
MSDPFLSSDDYGERAHQLYNEGRYDEAMEILRDGLEVYPFAVDLHVGLAYARLAREEFIWARNSFEEALALDVDHEDALTGFGETLLKFGQHDRALKTFERVLELGFREDHDLVLQIGRALFREGLIEPARNYFELAVQNHGESSEASACLGYAVHRLGNEEESLRWLRRALELETGHAEARIYLANLLYDRGEYDAALYHFERTEPADHVEELAVWRLIELKKSVYRLPTDDPELVPWVSRLREFVEQQEPEDQLLAEVESTQPDGSIRDPRQLELFGALVSEVRGMRRPSGNDIHRVTTPEGLTYNGTWEEIVLQMRRDDRECTGESLTDYMEEVSRRNQAVTGVIIPASDAEAFIRGSAAAGLLSIVR